MFCKWCGLESETSDLCSWFRRPFSITEVESAVADAEAVRAPEVTGVPTDDAPPAVTAFRTTERPSGPILLADGQDLDEDSIPTPFAARPTPLPEEPPAPSGPTGGASAAPPMPRPAQ